MKVGDKVTIYTDLITCKKPEGKATIVKIDHQNKRPYPGSKSLSLCRVRFEGSKSVVRRVIVKEIPD